MKMTERTLLEEDRGRPCALPASRLFSVLPPDPLGLPLARLAEILPEQAQASFDGTALRAGPGQGTELFAARLSDGSASLYLLTRGSGSGAPQFPATGAAVDLAGSPVVLSRFSLAGRGLSLRCLELALQSRIWESDPRGASPLCPARRTPWRPAERFREAEPLLGRAVRSASGPGRTALLDPESRSACVFVRCPAEEARTGGCAVAAVTLTASDPHPRHGPGLTASLVMPPGLFAGREQARRGAALLNRLEGSLPLAFSHCGGWHFDIEDTVRYIAFLPDRAGAAALAGACGRWARDFCRRALWADRVISS